MPVRAWSHFSQFPNAFLPLSSDKTSQNETMRDPTPSSFASPAIKTKFPNAARLQRLRLADIQIKTSHPWLATQSPCRRAGEITFLLELLDPSR
jgi:hypothetical protein